MNVRAVAMDLDGTLLLPTANLSPRTAEALTAAAAAGIEVIVASARWMAMAKRVVDGIDTARLAIACSGAQVRRFDDGVDVFDRRLPAEFTRELMAICDDYPAVTTIAFEDDVVVRLEHPPQGNPASPEMRYRTKFGGLAPEGARIAMAGPEAHSAIRDQLEARWSSEVNFVEAVSSSGRMLLTLTAKGADKGSALLAACRELGIAPADVVAFGDSENDLPMFAVAGASVAMANGTAEAKAAASLVTAANTEDGVAIVIERILRGEPLDTARRD